MGAVALSLAALGVLWLRRERPEAPGWPERALSAGMIGAIALGALTLIVAGRGAPLPRALSFTAIGVALFGMLLVREAVDGWRRRQRGLADRRLGRREWVLLLLGLALVAALLSLGPVVNLARRPIGPGLYAWLHPYLLPLRALRAANRIGVLVVFAVSLLASLGVTWLRAHLPRRGIHPRRERARSPAGARVRDLPARLRPSAGARAPRRPSTQGRAGRRRDPGVARVRPHDGRRRDVPVARPRKAHRERLLGLRPPAARQPVRAHDDAGAALSDAGRRGLSPAHLSARSPRRAAR